MAVMVNIPTSGQPIKNNTRLNATVLRVLGFLPIYPVFVDYQVLFSQVRHTTPQHSMPKAFR